MVTFSSSSEPISNLFLILKTAARTWPLDVEYIVYGALVSTVNKWTNCVWCIGIYCEIVYGALVYTVNSQLETHAFAHFTLLF